MSLIDPDSGLLLEMQSKRVAKHSGPLNLGSIAGIFTGVFPCIPLTCLEMSCILCVYDNLGVRTIWLKT